MEMEKLDKLELLDLKTVKVLEKDEQLEIKGGKEGGASAKDWTAIDTR